MPVPIVTYTPSKADAQGVAFAGVPFNDPVDTAYPSSDPDRVDAKYFLNQVQCEILLLEQLASMGGGAIQVRNATGGALAIGPVRVSGYYADNAQTGNPIFKIVAADAGTNTFANALLLTALADATTGVAYLGGDFTPSPALDTSGGAVGDQVYLKNGGGMTLVAPTAADQMVQVIGQIKTVNATGVVAGFVRMPKSFGTSFLQALAVTAAKIGSGSAIAGTFLEGDGAGGASFVNRHVLRVKATDTTKNNSTTLSNDADLKFPILNGETWQFEVFGAFTSAASDVGVDVSMSGPTTTFVILRADGQWWSSALTANPYETTLGNRLGHKFFTFYTQGIGILMTGIVKASADGTMNFEWSQNVATVEDTKLKANSYLKAWRIG